MLAYGNRTPDVTLTKFEHYKRQTYLNRQLKCSRTLSILLYLMFTDVCECVHVCWENALVTCCCT